MSLALTAIWPVSRRDSHNRRQFIAKVQFGPARRLVPAVLYLFHHKFQSSPQFLINYWPQCRDNRGEISYSKVLHFIWIGYNSNQWVFQCLVRLHLILWCPPTMASLRIHGKKFKILHTNVFMQILSTWLLSCWRLCHSSQYNWIIRYDNECSLLSHHHRPTKEAVDWRRWVVLWRW